MNSYSNFYVTVANFNILFTFLRILQFFSFSKKLSFFTDILSSAKYDIIFFILMFSIILFGYALGGYALFGFKDPSFNGIVLSITQLFIMLKGNFGYTGMYNADSSFAGFFLVTFEVMFLLGLLNMFIAIIVAHFNANVREQ